VSGFDRERSGRRVALVAIAVLALGLAFIVFDRSRDEKAGAMTRAAAPPPRDKVVRPLPPAAQTTAVGSASPIEATPRGEDEVQLCGGAWIRMRADGSGDPVEVAQAVRVPETRARMVAKLLADPSALAQAAAMWVTMTGAGAEPAQLREALAHMAVSSTDPKMYGMALRVCGADAVKVGTCQMLSAGQWARLDPGNASPWLALLSEARARKERGAEDEALHRIATAKRSDDGYFAIPGLIANAAPPDDASALAAWGIAIEAIGHAAAWNLPGYQDVVGACKGLVLRDANRRQTCAAIADVLSERSDTILAQFIGFAIGRELGWPAERQDRLRGEHAAYAASSMASGVVGESQPGVSCAGLRFDLDSVRRRADLGETGALREWVAQSGKKPEDFIREERTRQKEGLAAARAQAASEAASAASAAAAR
jgi:hypothetical protein